MGIRIHGCSCSSVKCGNFDKVTIFLLKLRESQNEMALKINGDGLIFNFLAIVGTTRSGFAASDMQISCFWEK